MSVCSYCCCCRRLHLASAHGDALPLNAPDWGHCFLLWLWQMNVFPWVDAQPVYKIITWGCCCPFIFNFILNYPILLLIKIIYLLAFIRAEMFLCVRAFILLSDCEGWTVCTGSTPFRFLHLHKLWQIKKPFDPFENDCTDQRLILSLFMMSEPIKKHLTLNPLFCPYFLNLV